MEENFESIDKQKNTLGICHNSTTSRETLLNFYVSDYFVMWYFFGVQIKCLTILFIIYNIFCHYLQFV